VAFSHRLAREWRLFAEAGGKYPFYNSNTLYLEIETEPHTATVNPVVKPEPRWLADNPHHTWSARPYSLL
jgi:hypothetical protein